MAFLGIPTLTLGEPSRPHPTSPGTVRVSYTIPFYLDLLEICFMRHCEEAAHTPIFDITAGIWSTDRNEPKGTFPISPDRLLFPLDFHYPGQASVHPRRKITGEDILNAQPVANSGNGTFLLLISDAMTVEEWRLNEDWGPFPPPGARALDVTRDEVFLRAQLASIFSAWEVISTKDSLVATGQFFGP